MMFVPRGDTRQRLIRDMTVGAVATMPRSIMRRRDFRTPPFEEPAGTGARPKLFTSFGGDDVPTV